MGWDKNAFGLRFIKKMPSVLVNGAALEEQRCDPSAARETVGAGRMHHTASGAAAVAMTDEGRSRLLSGRFLSRGD